METTRGRRLGPGRIDQARVAATTEADTRRHLAEDGFDPDTPLTGFRPVPSVAAVRRKAGLSQDKFAAALRIPVGTIRNWEQRRSVPDPAAQALLTLVDDDPERAFKVLAK
ncbi:helix-turn-helix domain-containing protein [Lichenihabitans sp. Uapishka_5]|uniref:helix-turn-helix domain-containing protein n=1 Tax=Lichenihabitans sp. Uapishka_5 TaxID=3037302 RepID=UPI0029E7E532|nr:helix-turn-helix domain-containing protein [Lichenihabitans sp. Uapishka_5]MDX7952777.1 helix-turn-helix domain-containing protein [Lichenihabitans sp. Uapishka_5]